VRPGEVDLVLTLIKQRAYLVNWLIGRAIVQAVIRRLPTAEARVRSQVMWDLWYTK
jgi:hypothetical protein